MRALVFSTQKDAEAQQAALDAALGYPKAGVDVGEGRHVPPSESITRTYAAPIQQDDLTWAYPVDEAIEAVAPELVADVAIVAEPLALGPVAFAEAAAVDATVDSPQPK